ncbi:MAG: Gfo/Idh/MocA family oxidoreductase [Planctomycetes bacterium]|nr:Gfo/Idh/MocA family oxidoreductase [Planctomycetota bacterium]
MSNRSFESHFSRRHVMQGAGALGFAAAANLILARGARAAGTSRAPELKIGVIGSGGRGTGAVLQALAADPDTVLWSVGDVFAERITSCLEGIAGELGDAAAKRVQVPEARRFAGFDAYKKVLESGVDVVILTTPPGFRPMHFKAAVDAKKHVFLEKPVAVDGPGLRLVMEAARDAKQQKLAVVCGFCWRYNAGMRATFGQVNGGAIGEVVSVHTTYHTGTLQKRPRQASWSDMEFQLRNWWHFTWLSGDHVVEQAVHSIDRLSWATGDKKPLRATCLGGRAARSGPEHGNAFDHFAIVYEYEGGMRTYHTCRQIDGCPSDNTDYIYGTNGSCTVNGWVPQYDVVDRAGKLQWKFEGDVPDMYQVEHDELFASIRKGEPKWDGDLMVHSTLLAIMGRMAAYTGQTIGYAQALESKEDLLPAKLEFGELASPPVAIPGQTKFA